MRKRNFRTYKHMKMKITVFDEIGKKIYEAEDEPKKCIKDIVYFGRFGLSVIDLKDVVEIDDLKSINNMFKEERDKFNKHLEEEKGKMMPKEKMIWKNP